MKLSASIFLLSTIALGQAKYDAPRIGDALRCENGKCASKPADGPVIVQLLKELEAKESRIRQQEARIQYLEKQVRLMPEKSHAVGTVERKKAK